jgi:TetR/AcrR family transcriptional repressor of nem operon
VQKRVNRHLDTLEALIRRALEAAQANGELSPDKDPKGLAAFLMCNIWGLRVLGGTAPTRKRTQAVVRQLLALLVAATSLRECPGFPDDESVGRNHLVRGQLT